MRVLILGCGYVGVALGARLADSGHEVLGLRRTLDVSLADIGIRPVQGDLSRPEDLAALEGPFDAVVNTVSSSRGGDDQYRQVFLQGTQNILNWLARMPVSKYVFTSSTSVYGQTDGSEVDETSPAEPATRTSQLLRETEELILKAAREQVVPGVVLRVAGIYGPDRGYLYQQFVKDEARLDGDGSRLLNMIHRDDVAGCLEAALEKATPGEIYNAVDDLPVSQHNFFEWLSQQLNKPMPPRASAEDQARPRKRARTNKRVSNRKLKAALEYQFRYPTFREGYGPHGPAGARY